MNLQRNISLATKLVALMAIVLVMALGFQAVWSYYVHSQQVSKQMLTRAEDVALELESIGRGAGGLENAADIVLSFSQEAAQRNNVGIAFFDASGAASSAEDSRLLLPADTFVTEALDAIAAGELGLDGSYYRFLDDGDGKRVFRYVRMIDAQAAGTGSATWAVSISLPVDVYEGSLVADVLADVSVVGIVVLAVLGAVFLVVRRWLVEPVRTMDAASAAIARGDFGVSIPAKERWRDELDDLAEHMGTMAHELEGLYADLESQVETRTAELRQANDLLEQANARLKEDGEYRIRFLSTMSHDLRTPLTAILAFLDVWDREYGPRNQDEANIVSEIRVNGKMLLGRVNNILEVSRIDAGRVRMEREEVDPVDLVSQVRSTMGPLADRKGVTLSVEVQADAPIIWGDGEKLLRILENLVENAVKYTQPGGAVWVRVSCDADADSAVFTVTDDGPGIEAESLPAIFDGFTQGGGASARVSEGSGLGLAVVRELAQLHGGTASVQSRVGVDHGTVFTVRIPVSGGQAEGEVKHA